MAGIGIDFGATAWRVAVAHGTECEVVPAEAWVRPRGDVIRSVPGRKLLSIDGRRVISPEIPCVFSLESPKRNLGTPRLMPSSKSRGGVPYEEHFRADLGELRARLANHLGVEIIGAVISVPPGYGTTQRSSLRELAVGAGFGMVQLVDDTLAATLATHVSGAVQRDVLVYSLGKSGFCASVVRMETQQLRSLSHEGSDDIGGASFDALLLHTIVEEQKQPGFDLLSELAILRALPGRIGEARVALDTASRVPIELGPMGATTARAVIAPIELEAETVERILAPLIEASVELARLAVREAGLHQDQVCDILLVGRVANTRMVRAALERGFPGVALREAPSDAVAKGAALQAASTLECFGPPRAARAPRVPAAGSAIRPAAALGSKHVERPSIESGREEQFEMLARVDDALSRNDIPSAIRLFHEFIGRNREELAFLYTKHANALCQQQEISEAIHWLERARKEFPDHGHVRERLVELYAAIALSHMRANHFSKARRALSDAHRCDPKSPLVEKLARELNAVTRGGLSRRRPGIR